MLNGGVLDGNRVLKPRPVRLMGENAIGDLVFNPLRTAMPAFSNDCDPWPDQPKKWGPVVPDQHADDARGPQLRAACHGRVWRTHTSGSIRRAMSVA